MAQQTRHISHLKSKALNASNDGPKLPPASALKFGEIAINYKKGYETIAILNDTSGITKFTNDATMLGNMDLKDQAASAVTLNAAKAAAVSSAITKVTGSTVLLNLSAVNATGRTLSAEVSSKVVIKDNDQGVFVDGNVMLGAGNNHIKDSAFNINTFVRTQATGTTLNANKIIMGGGNKIVSASSYSVSTDMPTNTSSAETLVPSSKAVAQAIEESFKAQNAMRYKGMLGSNTNFKALRDYKVGDTYVVATAFTTDSGAKLEVGDLIIAMNAPLGPTVFNESDFNFIQTNLDPTLFVTSGKSSNDALVVATTDAASSGRTITVSHKTGKKISSTSFVKVKTDNYGHVIDSSAVALSDLTNLKAVSGESLTSGSIIVGKGGQGVSASTININNVVITEGTSSNCLVVGDGGNAIVDTAINASDVVTADTTFGANKIIVGNGEHAGISASSYSVDTSINMQSPSTGTVPTSKAVYDVITANCISSVSASAPLSSYTSNGAVTISHNNSGVSSGTYGGSGTVTTPITAHITGGTFNLPKFTVNDTGHITSASNIKYTTPNSYGAITVYNQDYISASTYSDTATFIDGDGISMEAGEISDGVSTVYGIKFSVTDIICGDY